jgi:phage shock protein A
MFGRIANLFKGFFSLFISGVERRNPEALLELEQENLRKQIGQFNQGLASHAGLCERLMTQVKKLEASVLVLSQTKPSTFCWLSW